MKKKRKRKRRHLSVKKQPVKRATKEGPPGNGTPRQAPPPGNGTPRQAPPPGNGTPRQAPPQNPPKSY
jgi:hypothetical protein